jgi:phosphoglycolate phosphatase
VTHVEAVIFDFDFTLADSSQPITECMIRALDQLGFPVPTPVKIAETIGLSLTETFRQLTGEANAELVREFVRCFHARADQIMDRATQVYDSVRPVMQTLRAAHIRTGIVTTKLNYRVRNILAANRLEEFFDVIVGADDVGQSKPDPEGLRLALQQLNVAPLSAAYVGDHIVDAQAASNAGIPFIAALSGRFTSGAFEAFPYIAIVESIRDLPYVLSLC